jgi:hypothetical protein
MADVQSIRRRAAASVLGKWLDEAALMEVLWLQHETMRGDTVADIIAFIDNVARRTLLDAAVVKRLYNEFYKALREREDRLPPDPWPAMQASRPARAAPPPPPPRVAPVEGVAPPAARVAMPAPVPAAAPVINPVAAALAAAQAAAPAPDVPAEPSIVFGALMCAVVAEVYQFHREALDEVRKDSLRRLESSLAAPALRQQFRAGWGRALQHDWQLPGSHGDLAELVRVLYLALLDAFGRAGADQILRRGLDAAEAVPEARTFSPRRLLATIGAART